MSCHGATSAVLTGLSVSRASTLEIQMLYEIPDKFPTELIKKIAHFDAGTRGVTWPTVFEPSQAECLKCKNFLPKSCKPHGQSITSTCYLLTPNNPFKPVTVLVKKCTSKHCQAINCVFPYNFGKFVLILRDSFYPTLPYSQMRSCK